MKRRLESEIAQHDAPVEEPIRIVPEVSKREKGHVTHVGWITKSRFEESGESKREMRNKSDARR
jgi:hypothetical protein